jgi:hypothetical protein
MGRLHLDRNEFLATVWKTYGSGALIPVLGATGYESEELGLDPSRGTLSTIDELMTLSQSICPRCARAGSVPKPRSRGPTSGARAR